MKLTMADLTLSSLQRKKAHEVIMSRCVCVCDDDDEEEEAFLLPFVTSFRISFPCSSFPGGTRVDRVGEKKVRKKF